LGIKLDACPGRLNQVSTFIKREGTFYGQCSEICGVNHGFMPIVIEGVSMHEFVLRKYVNAVLDIIEEDPDLELFEDKKGLEVFDNKGETRLILLEEPTVNKEVSLCLLPLSRSNLN